MARIEQVTPDPIEQMKKDQEWVSRDPRVRRISLQGKREILVASSDSWEPSTGDEACDQILTSSESSTEAQERCEAYVHLYGDLMGL